MDNTQSSKLDKISSFDLFVTSLSHLISQPIPIKELKQQFKLPKKSFPSIQKLIKYFREEFSTRTTQEQRNKWHLNDKYLLFWIVYMYCKLNKKSITYEASTPDNQLENGDWDKISEILCVDKSLLKRKWLGLIKTQIKNQPWNDDEDTQILQIIENLKEKNWTQIAQIFYEQSQRGIMRSAKQIRERFNNYLDPNLKKCDWNVAEDQQLIALIKQHGKKWSLIKGLINGRTECQVKNRYNAIFNKLQKFIKNKSENQLVEYYIQQLEQGFQINKGVIYDEKYLLINYQSKQYSESPSENNSNTPASDNQNLSQQSPINQSSEGIYEESKSMAYAYSDDEMLSRIMSDEIPEINSQSFRDQEMNDIQQQQPMMVERNADSDNIINNMNRVNEMNVGQFQNIDNYNSSNQNRINNSQFQITAFLDVQNEKNSSNNSMDCIEDQELTFSYFSDQENQNQDHSTPLDIEKYIIQEAQKFQSGESQMKVKNEQLMDDQNYYQGNYNFDIMNNNEQMNNNNQNLMQSLFSFQPT